MYDPSRQYRCSLIRGKALKQLDDLLPAYANIITSITPIQKEDFGSAFNKALSKILPEASKKTLDNHRTEIAGKLFGMFLEEDDTIIASERTRAFLTNNDQPRFFKELCYKLQFPNGLDNEPNLLDKIRNEIHIKPCCFIIWLLNDAGPLVKFSVDDIGYYVLNSKDALQGKALPNEIIARVFTDHRDGVFPKVSSPNKASSYNVQHIRELLSYMELANLIVIDSDRIIHLNLKEKDTIDCFIKSARTKELGFDVYSFDLSSNESRKGFYYEWAKYYTSLSECYDAFETSLTSLDVEESSGSNISSSGDNTEIGDYGEKIVFEYERQRVGDFDKHLLNKVKLLGKIHGLGYDIQSVIAKNVPNADFAKFIEVKATKRVTAPDFKNYFEDSVNVTRNEYTAAIQNKEFYSIYRVYVCRNSIIIAMIDNVDEKIRQGILRCTPTHYRLDFGTDSFDFYQSIPGVSK